MYDFQIDSLFTNYIITIYYDIIAMIIVVDIKSITQILIFFL